MVLEVLFLLLEHMRELEMCNYSYTSGVLACDKEYYKLPIG